MILAWNSFSTPGNQLQGVFFFHSKDWIYPLQSLSDPVFNGAFEALLKFGQDSQATRISVPSQNKKDEGLTLFHTAALAGKRRIPEHFQNKVNLYFFGFLSTSNNEFKVYACLPSWISVFEISQDPNCYQWTRESSEKRRTDQIEITQQNASFNSEFLFHFGNLNTKNREQSIQKAKSNKGMVRIMDLLESQNTPLQGPLTTFKIKQAEVETGFKEFET